MKPFNPKGNQPWIFIERADAEAEAPILWPPNVKNQLTGKDPDAGQDWRQEKMGMKEDEIVLWPHWLVGYEFEHGPEVVMASEEGHVAVHGLAKIQTWLSDWNNYPTFYVLDVMSFIFLYFLINKVL